MSGLLIFDGECGFCTTSANWIRSTWRDPKDRATPWQLLSDEELERIGLTREGAALRAYWSDESGLYGAQRAIARAMRAGRWPWGVLGRILDLPPLRIVGGPVYRLVARYRHRLPGGTPACRL